MSKFLGVVGNEDSFSSETLNLLNNQSDISKSHFTEEFLLSKKVVLRQSFDQTLNKNGITHSISYKYLIAFDGVVYNLSFFKSLLEKNNLNYQSCIQSVLAESVDLMGVEWVLGKINGKFSLLVIDKVEEKIILARDRIGLNNTYYGFFNNKFIFSNNLNQFNVFKDGLKISHSSVGLYLQFSSIPAPHTIYENIYKLEPGEFLIYNLKNEDLKINKYWNLKELYQQNPIIDLSENEAINYLNDLINKSVESQTYNKSNVGAYLSGGIDSSTIASVMQSQSSRPIQTISIGFNDEVYDEAKYSKEIAKYLGTNHIELIISDQDLFDVLPFLPAIYDEPFSESSQISTFLASKLAKEHLDVVLTGDAGDELFGGYKRYQFVKKINDKLNKIPDVFKSFGKHLDKIPVDVLNALFIPLKFIKGKHKDQVNYGDKILKGVQLLKYNDRTELYHKGFMSHNNNAHKILNNFKEAETLYLSSNLQSLNYYDEMMILDLLIYLPNSNIKKVSAIADYLNLDSRTPLLNNEIVDFAINLPLNYKIKANNEKWILKEVLYKYVPENYFNRPKKGFSVPLNSWIRGSLKDYSYEMLFNKGIDNQEIFNVDVVKKYWGEHQSGKRNWGGVLWDIIMFNAWLDYQNKN